MLSVFSKKYNRSCHWPVLGKSVLGYWVMFFRPQGERWIECERHTHTIFGCALLKCRFFLFRQTADVRYFFCCHLGTRERFDVWTLVSILIYSLFACFSLCTRALYHFLFFSNIKFRYDWLRIPVNRENNACTWMLRVESFNRKKNLSSHQMGARERERERVCTDRMCVHASTPYTFNKANRQALAFSVIKRNLSYFNWDKNSLSFRHKHR